MISVIIPAYNAARTLPDCLTALKTQKLAPDEIIVVDDGSTDGTVQAARENGAQVVTQSHQGPGAARNAGIRQAKGDLLLFTDADCTPVQNWTIEMSGPFVDPLVAGVKGSYVTAQAETVARLVQCEFEERYDMQDRHSSIDLIDTYSAAFRADVLRDVGGFDPAFPEANEDVELSYRLARAGKRLLFHRQAVVSHLHPSCWTTYFRTKIKRGYWRILVYRLYPDKALHDSYTPQLMKLQVGCLYLALLCAFISLVLHPFIWAAVAALIGSWLSAIPFFIRVKHKDIRLIPAAVGFITVRTFAFAIGIAGGVMAALFFQPRLHKKNTDAVRPRI